LVNGAQTWRVSTDNCQEAKTPFNGVNYVTGTTCTVSVTVLEGANYNMVDGTSVYARIIARNILGDSISSDIENGAVIPRPPDSPVTATCAIRTIDSIQVTWSNGASNGGAPVTGYTVSRQPVGNTDPTTFLSVPFDAVSRPDEFTNRRFTFTGLTNGVNYNIIISSSNIAGASAGTTIQCLACQTPNAVSNVIENVAS
jgi:hypothetical protein